MGHHGAHAHGRLLVAAPPPSRAGSPGPVGPRSVSGRGRALGCASRRRRGAAREGGRTIRRGWAARPAGPQLPGKRPDRTQGGRIVIALASRKLNKRPRCFQSSDSSTSLHRGAMCACAQAFPRDASSLRKAAHLDTGPQGGAGRAEPLGRWPGACCLAGRQGRGHPAPAHPRLAP